MNLKNKDAIRVLVIEDHPLLRQGVAMMINQEKDMIVCGEVSNPREAVSAVQKHNPAVIILDLSLEGTSGIEVLKDIKAQFPKVKVLVLSMHDEAIYAPRALRAGALGYVMKQEASENVVAAIRRILTGQVALSASMSAKLLNSFTGKKDLAVSPVELLSDRELEVFSLLGQGHSTRDIATKLSLSMKTIESHRAHIKEKMQINKAADLVRHAIQWVSSEGAGATKAEAN